MTNPRCTRVFHSGSVNADSAPDLGLVGPELLAWMVLDAELVRWFDRKVR